jgi:orotate phosphoribosyltransferase
VITTGGSASRAVEALRREGMIPVGILALVDRQEGGRERLEALDLPVHALTTAADILAHITMP